MKTFYKFLTLITAIALFAAGCVNEDPAYKNETPEPPTPKNGFLALESMSMRVVYDTANDSDDTGNETQRPQSRATRTQPDVDNFWVELFDSEDAQIFKEKYADLKTNLTEAKLELPVGVYRLEVYSNETIPGADWESPAYSATQEVEIFKGQTTQIDEVVCTLSNVKVTLMCAADLAARLNSDKTKATISLGDAKIDFAINDMKGTRAAYFKAAELSNTVKFLLQGEFTDGKAVKFSKSISNVKAGQWRKITLVIEYADKGDIKFDIKVEGFEQDEEIVVDGTNGLWEPIFDDEPVIDPTAPAITWPGHDLSKPFQITASMFDENGDCTEPFKLDVTSPNGIETFMIDITSTSPDFVNALALVGITGPLDLCNFDVNSPAYTILGGVFKFPMNDKLIGKKSADFDLGMAIPMLYEFEGTHTFALDVTDTNGLNSEIQLVLIVDKANEAGGPVIEWVGYDLAQVYTLSTDMTIEVNVTATAGIKSFVVDIDSEVLKGMLGMVGMPGLTRPFDLCTIEDPEKGFLSGTVGFKTGDEVKNQTSVSFDINQFVEVLMGLGTPGERYNFRFEVTDNDDQITRGAIQLARATE